MRAQALRARRLRQALPGAALRRPAAACRLSAHACGASGDSHARRAVLRARRAPEERARAEPRELVRCIRRHHSVREPRHRRGASLLRPHRRGGGWPRDGNRYGRRLGEQPAEPGGHQAFGVQERDAGGIRGRPSRAPAALGHHGGDLPRGVPGGQVPGYARFLPRAS